MQNRTKTEEFLRAVELPEETKTYAVIGHGYVIDKIREMLASKGFVVTEELYKGENKGQEAMGFMQLENTKDPDMGMTFNWTNSYNKKLKFSCAIGGFIYDSKVPFVSSDSTSRYNRIHTGTALSETTEVIEQMIEQAEEHFDKIIEMKNKFVNIEISRKEYAKLMGLLYFDKQAISSEQINIVKREYDKPTFKCNHPGTLWSLYKMIMYAIVDQAPKQWYQQQIKINNYVQILYNIAHEDNKDGDTFVAQDEEPQTSMELSEEQIEMIESEYAYPLETVGVREFPLEDGQYGKPFDEENPLVEGEVTLENIPVEEKSEELQEIDDILVEKEQPAVSFFDSIDKKSSLESKSLMIVDFSDDPEPTVIINEKGRFEETATCDNCGSTDVIFNASAQMICDNCGHEEDTGLGDNDDEEFEEEEIEQVFEEEDDELNDMFLTEDTSDSLDVSEEQTLPKETVIEEFSMEEEPITIHIESDQEYANRVVEIEGEPEEEEVPWQTTETPEQMNALRNAMIAEEESSVQPELVKELHTEDLFSLEEEFEFEDEPVVTKAVAKPVVEAVPNPKIGEFIERFYKGDPNQKVEVTETEQYTIVELDTHETFVL